MGLIGMLGMEKEGKEEVMMEEEREGSKNLGRRERSERVFRNREYDDICEILQWF